MSYSRFKNDLEWSAKTHSYLVHRIRIAYLERLYPEMLDEIARSALPEDAFMVPGSRNNEDIMWTAVVDLTQRNGGVIPTRRDLATASGLSIMTVQKYLGDLLRDWLPSCDAREGSSTVLGSVFYIPDHVAERKLLREFSRIVILADMFTSPIYDDLIDYCKSYLGDRVYIGGHELDDPSIKGYEAEAEEQRLPALSARDGLELLRRFDEQPNTAVITDDKNWTLLCAGAGVAAFNTAMIQREFTARSKGDNDGRK